MDYAQLPWLLFFSFGVTLTYLPLSCLNTGVTTALAVLGVHDETVGRRRIVLHFLVWGFGCAVVGTTLLSLAGFWILGKLPIAADQAPWWMVFS